ncbi:transcription initiation factor IID, TAF10 subunit [Babesia caballi]|uniref:Transcription initiation factor IID, TAF10 subunit n=1 Tax=Babesia caballi TaxID=5871 RepID=A0AAV4LZY3_BABCB|nr:transcription initiation factor IID, TAF10 subunit [Babesia caballi]
MHRPRRRQPLGFESVARLIRSIAADAAVAHRRPERSAQILQKLRCVMPRATDVATEHPFHASVLAQRLAQATSKLDIPVQPQCATCRGACDGVHAEMLRCVSRALPYLAPKGVTQLQALYSACRNPQLQGAVLDIELRSAFLIFRAIRNGATDPAELDAGVSTLLESLHSMHHPAQEGATSPSPTGPSFHGFTTARGPQFVGDFGDDRAQPLDLTIRDVCAAVTAVKGESPARELLLYLAARALEQVDATSVDANDVKSVCRILHCLRKWHHSAKSLGLLVSSLAENHAHHMNAMDVACLLPHIPLQNSTTITPLLRRVRELLSNHGGPSLDARSISMLIASLAKLCRTTRSQECVDTIATCADAISTVVASQTAALGQPATFAAVVMVITTLRRLQWSCELRLRLAALSDALAHTQDTWIGHTRAYDLNELLEALAATLPLLGDADEPMDQQGHERHAAHPYLAALVSLIQRLSTLSEAAIDKHNHPKPSDGSPLRDVCQFLRIYHARHLHRVQPLTDGLHAKMRLLLLDHHQRLKPIDVVELAHHLQTVDPSDPDLARLLSRAIEKAEADPSVDERQWQRIHRIAHGRRARPGPGHYCYEPH